MNAPTTTESVSSTVTEAAFIVCGQSPKSAYVPLVPAVPSVPASSGVYGVPTKPAGAGN